MNNEVETEEILPYPTYKGKWTPTGNLSDIRQYLYHCTQAECILEANPWIAELVQSIRDGSGLSRYMVDGKMRYPI